MQSMHLRRLYKKQGTIVRKICRLDSLHCVSLVYALGIKIKRSYMKCKIILLVIFIGSYAKAGCLSEGCNSVEEFAKSYANAVAEKNENLIKKHYYSNDYTCNIHGFYIEGSYTGYSLGEKTELKAESWDHFELTLKSKATKIKLFYDLKEKNPNKSDSEIMRLVFKELLKSDLNRVEVPMIAAPSISVPLSIHGRIYHKDHPCMAYTATSLPIYLINTDGGLKAVEPACDVGRAVGETRIDRSKENTEAEKIYKSLSSHQIEYYKKRLEAGRISTVKQLAKDLSLKYSDAKYVIFEKVCPLIP